MALSVARQRSAEEFLDVAGNFLARHEAEHNLLFGICSAIRLAPDAFGEEPPRFLTVSDAAGGVVAAALQTPPNNLVLSQSDEPGAISALADAVVAERPPGILAPTELAATFLSRWAERTGEAAHLEVAERIFRLHRVIPPGTPAAGSWRLANPADRELVAAWVVAFSTEAMPEQPPIDDPLGVADRWIARINRLLYLWEDRGRVVSLVGAGGETPNGIRIGPVYTPPRDRGHGYATSLTAAASADQLARGRRFCFLFTDLANPTSNAIYRSIGYEPVCDMDQYRFDR
ncbi:MAG TPA: GNAT family N-acetyltransferase [Candidatus Limnocylindria bacterium]|nr:GNAT family N-acetyltransferase [Candidatus Limnocylindria bacterium]